MATGGDHLSALVNLVMATWFGTFQHYLRLKHDELNPGRKAHLTYTLGIFLHITGDVCNVAWKGTSHVFN